MNRRFRIVMATATFWLSAAVALALLVPPAPVSARSAHATATAVVAPPGGWARQPIDPGPAPTEADGFLGYDSATGHLLYFNGIFAGAPSNDLWSFDPTTNAWTLVVANGTAPNVSTLQRNVAWDPVGRRFLAVNSYGPTTDVVTFDADSNTWSTVHTVGGPRNVSVAGVVWDTFAQRLIMFGGCYGSDICQFANNLWSYDPVSQSWTLLHPSGAVPPATDGAVTVWDANDHMMWLVGGTSDVWSWNSATNLWAKLAVTDAGGGQLPSTRGWASATWDPIDRQLLLFGGTHYTPGVGFVSLDELWALHPDTRSWAQLPEGGLHPPASARNGDTLTDAAAWDPATRSMRVLALDPASPTPLTALWSYRPLPPVPGGLGFGMRVRSGGATLSWQTGDSQTGYRVIRRDGASTTVVGGTLPADATGYVDPTPAGPLLCYQLATLGGSVVVAHSGMLCAMASGPATPRDPQAPGISFVTGSRVTVQWDPPAAPAPVFGGFTIWRADEFLIVLVGAATTYTTDPIVGHSCWYVRAHDGAGWSGRTSTVCALPEYGSR